MMFCKIFIKILIMILIIIVIIIVITIISTIIIMILEAGPHFSNVLFLNLRVVLDYSRFPGLLPFGWIINVWPDY